MALKRLFEGKDEVTIKVVSNDDAFKEYWDVYVNNEKVEAIQKDDETGEYTCDSCDDKFKTLGEVKTALTKFYKTSTEGKVVTDSCNTMKESQEELEESAPQKLKIDIEFGEFIDTIKNNLNQLAKEFKEGKLKVSKLITKVEDYIQGDLQNLVDVLGADFQTNNGSIMGRISESEGVSFYEFFKGTEEGKCLIGYGDADSTEEYVTALLTAKGDKIQWCAMAEKDNGSETRYDDGDENTPIYIELATKNQSLKSSEVAKNEQGKDVYKFANLWFCSVGYDKKAIEEIEYALDQPKKPKEDEDDGSYDDEFGTAYPNGRKPKQRRTDESKEESFKNSLERFL